MRRIGRSGNAVARAGRPTHVVVLPAAALPAVPASEISMEEGAA
jgi:hypothetical protein